MDCGFDEGLAEKTMAPLFLSNAENLCRFGDVNSLTGPIERADADTIIKHLDCIKGDYLKTYALLSKELIKIAEKKNPDREYDKLRELILSQG